MNEKNETEPEVETILASVYEMIEKIVDKERESPIPAEPAPLTGAS